MHGAWQHDTPGHKDTRTPPVNIPGGACTHKDAGWSQQGTPAQKKTVPTTCRLLRWLVDTAETARIIFCAPSSATTSSPSPSGSLRLSEVGLRSKDEAARSNRGARRLDSFLLAAEENRPPVQEQHAGMSRWEAPGVERTRHPGNVTECQNLRCRSRAAAKQTRSRKLCQLTMCWLSRGGPRRRRSSEPKVLPHDSWWGVGGQEVQAAGREGGRGGEIILLHTDYIRTKRSVSVL